MADAAIAFDKQQVAVGPSAALEKVISMLNEIVAMEQRLESNLNAVTASGRFEEALFHSQRRRNCWQHRQGCLVASQVFWPRIAPLLKVA